MLEELYFVVAKEWKNRSLKDAKRWLNDLERVDAPQVAAQRWRAINLQRDGKRKFYSVFSTVFLLCLSCCLLLV